MYIIAGLGNPGEEYNKTRHNTGRIILDQLRSEFAGDEFKFDKKLNAEVSQGKIKGEKLTFVAPDTFMNNSGKTLALLVKNPKQAGRLIVIHDDFNLPIGRMKISFNRSSGGHNGVESIIKSLKTEAFTRLRIGVSPPTAKGIAKIPHGDEKIEKFILGPFKDEEMKTLKKISKQAVKAVEMIVKESREKAMSVYNAS